MNTPVYRSRTVQSTFIAFLVALLITIIPEFEPHLDALYALLGVIATILGVRFSWSNSDPA